MSPRFKACVAPRPADAGERGFSLVELMVSMVIGLLILGAMTALFMNTSTGNRELARANGMIENGRLAIELLQSDVVHAGYWGGYLPRFDDQTFETAAPADEPTAIPDPCLPFATPWTAAHRGNLINMPVQAYDARVVTDDALCADVIDPVPVPDTDILVVRHADLCVVGSGGNCEAETVGKLYFQAARCTNELPGNVLAVEDGNAATFPLTTIECDPAEPAEKRKFVSSIYYIRDYAVTAGDGIPTLMRSTFDLAGGVLEHQPPVPMVEGIQGFRVELGIDSLSETGGAIDYNAKVNWADPKARTTPTNRGDGSPDGPFVSCSAAGVPCTLAQLTNTTAVQLHVLVRSREPTPGYTDTKTYQLGDTEMGPFNDEFKRHVYVSTVRLPNVAGRRITP
jgi:type IV pilus assembly protein PilW